jgi:putative hemolysin
MLESSSNLHQVPARRYHVSLAVDDSEIREAQRLRYMVFAEEMGARLSSLHPGLDTDLYDPYCDHLLVREMSSGEVVGTYRILTPDSAQRVGSYYSEQEFDLTRLSFLRPRMAELGRSCVHPAHRSGGVIARLWIGLADYMTRYGYEYIVGCASVGMAEGGHAAASIHRQLAERHLAPIEWRVTPRTRLPLESLDDGSVASLPTFDQGLHPDGRDDLRRACLGSGLQHRRHADAAADGPAQPRLCPSLHRLKLHPPITMRG